MKDFIAFLEEELNKKNWTRAELSRRSNVDQSTLSMIYSEQRKPGPEVCVSIAHALGLPPEIVFREAGLLPPEKGIDEVRKEILDYKLAELSDDELDRVIEYIEFLQHRKQDVKINREGVTPPEVIKTKDRT